MGHNGTPLGEPEKLMIIKQATQGIRKTRIARNLGLSRVTVNKYLVLSETEINEQKARMAQKAMDRAEKILDAIIPKDYEKAGLTAKCIATGTLIDKAVILRSQGYTGDSNPSLGMGKDDLLKFVQSGAGTVKIGIMLEKNPNNPSNLNNQNDNPNPGNNNIKDNKNINEPVQEQVEEQVEIDDNVDKDTNES